MGKEVKAKGKEVKAKGEEVRAEVLVRILWKTTE